MVCTAFSQHCQTHQACLLLIGVLTRQAGLHEGCLKQTAEQILTTGIALSAHWTSPLLTTLTKNTEIGKLTDQLLEELLRRQVHRKGVYDLDMWRRTGVNYSKQHKGEARHHNQAVCRVPHWEQEW